MPVETPMLCVTAIVVGVLHTILGPDHYLPFVAMAEAGGWSARRSVAVTAACGLSHVIGSVVIGIVGLALGVAVMRLEAFEAYRGDAASWLLIGFGLALLLAGVRRAGQERERGAMVPAWAPWLAFLVFVLGPCEPLIPLLMVPAAQGSPAAVAAVVAAYAAATVGTMVVAVLVMRYGLSRVRWPAVGRVGHAVAGLVILACGVLVKIGL
jgi:nickel/cobalt exporter